MSTYDSDSHINVGTGEDQTIRELAELVRAVVAPEVELVFDPTKPDGSPRKLLDVSKLHNLGWSHRTQLRDGIEETYRWFVEHFSEAVAARHPPPMLVPAQASAALSGPIRGD